VRASAVTPGANEARVESAGTRGIPEDCAVAQLGDEAVGQLASDRRTLARYSRAENAAREITQVEQGEAAPTLRHYPREPRHGQLAAGQAQAVA
jgi:hypothetical protein